MTYLCTLYYNYMMNIRSFFLYILCHTLLKVSYGNYHKSMFSSPSLITMQRPGAMARMGVIGSLKGKLGDINCLK